MRFCHLSGVRKTAKMAASTKTGTRTTRLRDRNTIKKSTTASPINAPREYVKKIAGIVATKQTPIRRLIRRLGSWLARKKKIGRVMFHASPQSPLSGALDPGGAD